MCKSTVFLAVLVVLFVQNASASTYRFSHTSFFNVSLDSSSSLSLLDDNYGNINLSFPFRFYGVEYSSIYVSSNGYVSFGMTPPFGYGAWPMQGYSSFIAFFACDLYPVGIPIVHGTIGQSPNRTFVLQFWNVPLFSDRSKLVRLQLLLHESTNRITFLYYSTPSVRAATGLQDSATNYLDAAIFAANRGVNRTAYLFEPEGTVCLLNCLYGGSCVTSANTFVCRCPGNRMGEFCEQEAMRSYEVRRTTYAYTYPIGTPLKLSDDALSGFIPFNFTFYYYGQPYTGAYISSNGFLTFAYTSSSSIASGTSIRYVVNKVAYFATDLNPSVTGSSMFYRTVGTAGTHHFELFLVNVPLFGLSDTVTLRVELQETSNNIEFHYTSTPLAANRFVTIGLAGPVGTPSFSQFFDAQLASRPLLTEAVAFTPSSVMPSPYSSTGSSYDSSSGSHFHVTAHPNVPLIVGLSVGAFLLVVIVSGILCYRRHKLRVVLVPAVVVQPVQLQEVQSQDMYPAPTAPAYYQPNYQPLSQYEEPVAVAMVPAPYYGMVAPQPVNLAPSAPPL